MHCSPHCSQLSAVRQSAVERPQRLAAAMSAGGNKGETQREKIISRVRNEKESDVVEKTISLRPVARVDE